MNISSPETPVLYSEIPATDDKVIARATLNAPSSLNSLTMSMIQSLRSQLEAWRNRPDVVAVWLEGAGEKAFCAGGDIIKLYEAMAGEDYRYPDSFFEEEYSLDLMLHRYPKPLIAWGDGIVMGGGMGLMQGAKFRLVTERTMMAMPEITIGLYPDVGASYFLHKSPKPLGLFSALTGARLGAADAMRLNFADYFVPTSQKGALLKALGSSPLTLADFFKQQTTSFAEAMPPSQIEPHLAWINQTFSLGNLAQIDQKIRQHSSTDKWLSRTLGAYIAGSPTSAALIFEQLQRSAAWSLEEAFRHELAMSAHCARNPDLREGVRALLIDKDGKPRWRPSKLEEVHPSDISRYFSMPDGLRLELK